MPAVKNTRQTRFAPVCVGGIVAGMKTTFIALLAFSLCLPLAGAEKKTDVEKAGYKGQVKSVKVTAFKIEEKDGKQVRTQVRTSTPSAK